MNRLKSYFFFLLIIILVSACRVQYGSLSAFISSTPTLKFEVIDSAPGFESSWLVWVEQPIDHQNPSAGTFRQRVWLSHLNLEAPVVMVTEGYWAPANYTTELAGLLSANQIIVEHRYFGESVPETVNWKYLTADQAARDHERIIQLFKTIYKGRWVTTGISKGGQAALIHRVLYPKSVNATVTYVAPFNLSRDDVRLIDFFQTVPSAEIRGRIERFQLEVLKRRREVLPLFIDFAREKGMKFSMGYEAAFELAVLEYPFSLFQWCVPTEQIPAPGGTAHELLEGLYRGIDFSYFSEEEGVRMAPFFYQAYTELGYYGYLATPLKSSLSHFKTDTISSDFFINPEWETPHFNSTFVENILARLHRKDPRVLHITGAMDPWSATAPDISGLRNSVRIEDPNGCHLTRINSLPDSLRQEAISLLKEWVFMQ